MSFAELKRSSKTSLSKLTEELEKLNKPTVNFGEDERFWKPKVDKAGNGYAVIRFLPAPEGEDMPFVRVWDHGFQGPSGKWYIEKSLTTIGKQDPVSEANSRLWNTGLEENKKLAQARKRRLHFISNILVIKDSTQPETEGNVYLYEYGKKIFEKINDQMNPPEIEGKDPINPFDFWNGATFQLKIRKKDGYRNYDNSSFQEPEALADDDELEVIYKKEYSLKEFIDPTKFKTYEELLTKFNSVIGIDVEESRRIPAAAETNIRSAVANEPEDDDPPFDTDDDDEGLSFFKRLAEED